MLESKGAIRQVTGQRRSRAIFQHRWRRGELSVQKKQADKYARMSKRRGEQVASA